MRQDEVVKLLKEIKEGSLDLDGAIRRVENNSYHDLGYAKIDYDRKRRNGYPEVIYCEGKQPSHICGIVADMVERDVKNIMGTRASREVYEEIRRVAPDAEYEELARIVVINREEMVLPSTSIAVVTGGTADIPVAEEAAVTAEVMGNPVHRIYDVGVAGIHRLLDNVVEIRKARVVISVAGMEGALTSVVAGLVDKPVIGVPTSVGYGASFEGLCALLSMLNSCASGVSVVNIDNGFGAGFLASMINKIGDEG